MVRSGQYREDLWYCLNVCVLKVPPCANVGRTCLSSRTTSSPPGAPSGPHGFTPEAMRAVCAHAWPGNVRELRSAVERAATLAEGDCIDAAGLQPEVCGAPS